MKKILTILLVLMLGMFVISGCSSSQGETNAIKKLVVESKTIISTSSYEHHGDYFYSYLLEDGHLINIYENPNRGLCEAKVNLISNDYMNNLHSIINNQSFINEILNKSSQNIDSRASWIIYSDDNTNGKGYIYFLIDNNSIKNNIIESKKYSKEICLGFKK